MNVVVFGLLTIALYLFVAMRINNAAGTSAARINFGFITGSCAIFALATHALSLYPLIVIEGGINLGIFSAASLIAWLIAVLALTTAIFRPVGSLAVVILPFSALVIAVSIFFSSENIVPSSTGMALHIALSLIAYSLFAIATLQAIYLLLAEQRLKQHTPLFGFLPPLPVMEHTLFQITAVAFVTLSLGLLLGVFQIESVRGQHLSHKIVFSLLAWLVFACILWGRHFRHWRGRRASKYVIGGFVSLALGFFGSKIALELILQRA